MADLEKPDNKPTVKPQQERDAPGTAVGLVSGSLQRDPTFFRNQDVDTSGEEAHNADDSSDTSIRTARLASNGSDTAASSPLSESDADPTSAQPDTPKNRALLVGGMKSMPQHGPAMLPPSHPGNPRRSCTTQLSETSCTPSVNELANYPSASVSQQYEAEGHQLVNHTHTMSAPTSPSYAIYHGTPTDQDHGSNSPSKVVVS